MGTKPSLQMTSANADFLQVLRMTSVLRSIGTDPTYFERKAAEPAPAEPKNLHIHPKPNANAVSLLHCLLTSNYRRLPLK